MNRLVSHSCRSLFEARASARPQLLQLAQISRPSQLNLNLLSTSARRLSKDQNASNTNTDDFRHSEELAKERYDTRAGEDIERKRARLLYQSRKRGMLENGVILASFANKYLDLLDAKQLDEYDRLINLPTNDWDIFYWATKTKPTPAEFETPIMQKLREHLRSKVSNTNEDEGTGDGNEFSSNQHSDSRNKEDGNEINDKNRQPQAEDCVLGKSKPDEVVLSASKKSYAIEIDPIEEDLTNYKENLFDYRIKPFRDGKALQNMTEWRRQQLVSRLRRGLSSPVALSRMSDNKEAEVYTQRSSSRGIAIEEPFARDSDLIDSLSERKLKHHNFMQYLLGSDFTSNARDYDDEAEAWAEMIWHRDYGSMNHRLSPSSQKCTKCQARLHCCDPGHEGYIPQEIFTRITLPNFHKSKQQQEADKQVKCQKCNFSDTYNVNLSADVSSFTYKDVLRDIGKKPPSIVCLLVDLTDFPSGLWPNLLEYIGTHHRLIVVGNKVDLLPYDGRNFLARILESLKSSLSILQSSIEETNLHIHGTTLISARTGFGVEGLVTSIADICDVNEPRDVYLIGTNNSGKSTLFNALLQSDLCALRKNDILSRVSPYECSSTKLKMLKFPVAEMDGWQVEMKRRRNLKVEQNEAARVRSLRNTTLNRQESMPHMAQLINRLNYPAAPAMDQHLDKTEVDNNMVESTNLVKESDSLENIDDEHSKIRFAEDHPMANQQTDLPFAAAQGGEFADYKYFHYTPSATSPNQIHDLLTADEKLDVFNHETIIPRRYTLRPLHSLFIAGLARLDLLTCSSHANLVVFASRHLPVHCVSTRKADQFYNTFLGSPYLGVPNFGGPACGSSERDEDSDESMQRRLKTWPRMEPAGRDVFVKGIRNPLGGVLDIVFSSVGWVMVTLTQDQEALIRPHTPKARGIFIRSPPILRHANYIQAGRKVRNTPVFTHPHYNIEQMPA